MKPAVCLPLLLLLLFLHQCVLEQQGGGLNVYVAYGRGLRRSKTSSLTDAFVKVKVGDDTLSSRVIKGSSNPIWKQWLRFTFACVPSKLMVVYVHDQGGGGVREGLLGKKKVRLAQGDKWFSVKMRHGFVRVYYYYR